MELFLILKPEENRGQELERDQIIEIKSTVANFLLVFLNKLEKLLVTLGTLNSPAT